MEDLKTRIQEVISGINLAAFATIADAGPWVRYITVRGNEQFELRSAVKKSSRKVSQIANNPNVHLTMGISSLMDKKPYIQFDGVATVSFDENEKKEFWFRPLRRIFTGPDDPEYGIIIIKPKKIELLSPGNSEPEILEF